MILPRLQGKTFLVKLRTTHDIGQIINWPVLINKILSTHSLNRTYHHVQNLTNSVLENVGQHNEIELFISKNT